MVPDIKTSPLGYVLDEIERCLNANLFYAAVSLTLSLPDICSALETEPDQSRFGDIGKRYRKWCQDYAEPLFNLVKASDLWALRGGVHHNARLSAHPNTKGRRLLLMPPNTMSFVINEMEVSQCGTPPRDGLQVYIPFFCEKMLGAASDWWAINHATPIVMKNLPDLVGYRPMGMAPFMVGAPVIA